MKPSNGNIYFDRNSDKIPKKKKFKQLRFTKAHECQKNYVSLQFNCETNYATD